MVELVAAKCPSCGANLEFPEGMETGHCMHCGGKVIISKPEVHFHKDTHHHYEGSDFEKLKYNKELLEAEIIKTKRELAQLNQDIKQFQDTKDILFLKPLLIILMIVSLLYGVLANKECCLMWFMMFLIITIIVYLVTITPLSTKRRIENAEEIRREAKKKIVKLSAELEEIEKKMRTI